MYENVSLLPGSQVFVTQFGDSVLTKAAWRGHNNVVVELVKAGAKLDLQNRVRNYISHSYPSQKNEQP